jgi:hypothetical protein
MGLLPVAVPWPPAEPVGRALTAAASAPSWPLPACALPADAAAPPGQPAPSQRWPVGVPQCLADGLQTPP